MQLKNKQVILLGDFFVIFLHIRVCFNKLKRNSYIILSAMVLAIVSLMFSGFKLNFQIESL